MIYVSEYMVEMAARAMEPSAFATFDRGYTNRNTFKNRAFLNSEKTVKSARRKARLAVAAAVNAAKLPEPDEMRTMLLDALSELSAMYTHAWDIVGGGLMMHGASIDRFEKAHHAAHVAVALAKGLPPPIDTDEEDHDDDGHALTSHQRSTSGE